MLLFQNKKLQMLLFESSKTIGIKQMLLTHFGRID